MSHTAVHARLARTPRPAVVEDSRWRHRSLGGRGDVVGSNIINILLMLGVSAPVIPVAVVWPVVRLDVAETLALSLATLVLAPDGRVRPLGGVALLGEVVAGPRDLGGGGAA